MADLQVRLVEFGLDFSPDYPEALARHDRITRTVLGLSKGFAVLKKLFEILSKGFLASVRQADQCLKGFNVIAIDCEFFDSLPEGEPGRSTD